MKSSRSRSRSKNNRNRNSGGGGNVVNRVFDSSGPEGKVRGTPQQIIDKYNQLARDAQLSGDRVATENFQQHAEHYLRMLSEAQREQDARREEQERQNRERQAERDRERAERQEREAAQGGAEQQSAGKPSAGDPAPGDLGAGEQPDVIETGGGDDTGLVETPETQPKPRRTRARKPKAPKPEPEAEPAVEAKDTPEEGGTAPEAAE
ncbi:MAG: DUF4167 domain-containing protein [Pseudomonadota bacterium]